MSAGSASDRGDDFALASTNWRGDELPDDLLARVKSELEPGERLLWASQSDPPVEPRGMGFYFVSVVTLFFLGLGIFFLMASGVKRQRADDSAMTPGLVVLGIACLLIFWLFASWKQRRTERRRMANSCYAVTDRRAIRWTPEPDGKATRIQALARGQFRNLSRVESPDGSGHLEFSGTQDDNSFGYFDRFKFAHVREVRRVEQIVRSNLITSDSNVRESSERL
jgi:hypothetical protein